MARVTAAVLTYDGRELLAAMLPTLLAQTYTDFDVVVVDDGSTDGTPAYVREHWPNIRLVTQPANLGVAVALNAAVAHATGEYVALLNNDIELTPAWLGALVDVLDANPRAASATGKLLNFHRREEIEAVGDIMRWSGAAFYRGHAELDTGQYDAACEVFSPCAGAALYRRAALAEVGPFDEDFFAYLEDIDWGFRAQLAGWSCVYTPTAVAYHVGGATTGRNPKRFAALQRRNHMLVVLKNYPPRALLRHAPKFLLFQGGFLLASVRDGILGAYVRGLGQIVGMAPRLLSKRRAIQRTRRVNLDQLDALMSPEPYAGATRRERISSIATATIVAMRKREPL